MIPFVTSGGSGFGNALEDLEKSAKGAHIDSNGLQVLGTQVKDSKEKMKAWAENRI